jgi:hypothetical protein
LKRCERNDKPRFRLRDADCIAAVGTLLVVDVAWLL